VSEILHLQAGCVQRRDNGAVDGAITVIVGAIFKRQPDLMATACHDLGRAPAAVQAIAVLEALSARHRAQTKRNDLGYAVVAGVGATEWQQVCPGQLQISSAMNELLVARFTRLARLAHEGSPGD
jgi:hypothetical protein